MKIFYTLFLLVFLASCGANTATQVINEATDAPVANVEQDTPTETEEILDIEPDAEPDAPVESENPDDADAPEETWGTDAPAEDGDQDAPSEVADQIDAELETMEKEEVESTESLEPVSEQQSDEVSSGEMIEISTTYTNPAMEAIMNIAIEVNDENIIESIAITSPNYKWMPQFNTWVQGLVGKSLEEASEFYVSGSSLASPAFQAAIKGSL